MKSPSIIVNPPATLSNSIKEDVINLIAAGGQIKYEEAKVGIHRASLVAIYILDGKVISTASLKNPRGSYYDTLTNFTKFSLQVQNYPHELGYIATRTGFEGQKICQQVLNEIFLKIKDMPMFATTRKPEMIHILTKLGFIPRGEKYKTDLQLLTYK